MKNIRVLLAGNKHVNSSPELKLMFLLQKFILSCSMLEFMISDLEAISKCLQISLIQRRQNKDLLIFQRLDFSRVERLMFFVNITKVC